MNWVRVSPLFAKAIILACLFTLTGGPWCGLQFYAWTKMVWERSVDKGFPEAIVDVASGEDPCELCRFIQKERSKEKENEPKVSQNLKRQPMAVAQLVSVRPFAVLGRVCFFVLPESRGGRVESPPKPPPRWA